MALLHGFENPERYRGGYVAIGNFDGVHLGHQRMISTLTERAQAANVPAVVLTFDPHPIMLLKPEFVPPRLMTLQTKSELLHDYGVDHVIAYPTDEQLLNMTPEEFFEQFLLQKLEVRGLVEGPNFFFGRNRSGNVDTLRELCGPHHLSLDVIAAVKYGEEHVSSSAIRKAISGGDFKKAFHMLSHGYALVGTVREGDGRGRTLGFPTANLADVETLIPVDGVYGGWCEIDGKKYTAAVNIGTNPTFAQDEHKIEVHLIDFSGDLYDTELKVQLVWWVRDVQSFRSAEELQQQLEKDLKTIRNTIGKFGYL